MNRVMGYYLTFWANIERKNNFYANTVRPLTDCVGLSARPGGGPLVVTGEGFDACSISSSIFATAASSDSCDAAVT